MRLVLCTGEGPGGQAPVVQTFSADLLRSKTNQELGEILKAKSLNSRGKKEELVQRILDAQHRAKKPARP